MKNAFLFYQKNSFCSLDIHIFVLPSSRVFSPVSHCFRGWSKVNLKVYDVIKCLCENLIIHFVLNIDKEERYGIETLSIDKV